MIKNREAKQAIADAINWKGNIADGPAFANACVEFQDKYPGQFAVICQKIVQQYLSGKEFKV
jgi:hypothetical protein